MSNGFFTSAALSKMKKPDTHYPQCGKCGMGKKCHSKKIPTIGDFQKKILVVSECPGIYEDQNGIPFSGDSGKYIKRAFLRIGINLKRDCLLTSAIRCQPYGDKKSTDKIADMCSPLLINLIKKVKPNVVILLGILPTRTIIKYSWGENPGPLKRWIGFAIPGQRLNTWICPTYSRSYVASKKGEVTEKSFLSHIKQAVKKAKRPPYPGIMKENRFEKKVKIILDPTEAASMIKDTIRIGGICAFDYETNMLKPEFKKARIVSASICHDGKNTFAFPMYGKAQKWFIRFLATENIKKVAANMKFEDRWSRRILHTPVNLFIWDTMIMAHLLDSRKLITGLKFQTFLHTGTPSYDSHIKQYLKGDSGECNRINQIDLEDLLLYNGLDSLFTYMIYKEQRKQYEELP